MLPIFAGDTPSLSIDKSHPLVAGSMMVAAWRFVDGYQNVHTAYDLIGSQDIMILLNARCYGPDGPVEGSSARQSTGQFPRIPSTIWSTVDQSTFTFGFWAKFNAFPNVGAVVDTVNRNFSIFMGGGSPTTTFINVYQGGAPSSMTLSVTLQQDTWYRILVAVDNDVDRYVWINGELAASSLSVVTFPFTAGDAIDLGNNTSGGGNQFDGFMGDVFIWNKKLTDDEVARDYQEALYGFPGLFPRHNTWKRAPSIVTDATATVSSIGTITLTAPTATAFQAADNTGTVGSIGVITFTAPTVAGAVDGTGSVTTIGTIVLTPPTVSAGTPSNSATVGLIGVIYLQAPTVYPITSPLKNNYGTTTYWGRHMRGSYLNLQIQLPEQPFDVPIADIWSGTALIDTVEVPCLDPEDLAFGLPLFISDAYDDGNYFVVFRFTVKHIEFVQFAMFEVSGGVARHPVISVLEIQRALGQGVVSQRDDGVVHLGYNPSLSGELE